MRTLHQCPYFLWHTRQRIVVGKFIGGQRSTLSLTGIYSFFSLRILDGFLLLLEDAATLQRSLVLGVADNDGIARVTLPWPFVLGVFNDSGLSVRRPA